MKGQFEILMVIAVLCLPGVMSGETGPFFSRVDYAVSLPMADDDVIYNIELLSQENPSDSLLGENYLIRWSIPSRDNAEGFTAYFDGHFYSFSDNRLREYHYDWDSIPFRTSQGGIQRNAQFMDLFPFAIERSLAEMRRDSTYVLTETTDGKVKKIHGVRTLDGTEAMQFDLSVDSASGNPLRLTRLFNPGMLGEQEVTATYTYGSTEAPASVPASEDGLMALFPDLFARFRTSNYSIENLRGLPMPSFALPTLTRERFLYNKGERFPNPRIMAILDPEVATTGETIAAIRDAADRMPRQTGLIFSFLGNDTDRIESLTGPALIGETILTSARTLARDTGANSFPTIILLNSDGTVGDVILGFSTGLRDQLLQKASLLK